MSLSIFNEFALLFSLTAALGFIAIKLRQPLILAFIAVGVIAGPYVLGIITSHDQIEVLASFGVTLLLFIVGLKLDIGLIRAFGSIVLLLGLGQMALTAGLGYLLALILGLDNMAAIFVAIAMAFSSTIIIIKALSDKYDIDSLYGRIAVGILIVQDLVVVLAIITLSSLKLDVSSFHNLFLEIGLLVLKGAGFLVAIAILMRTVLPFIVDQTAESRELLVLFALAWAVILAAVANELGFGKEVGGFLAGVSLASTHYRESMASRLDTVRNLLLLFFFVNLGAALQFDAIQHEIGAVIVLSLFVLVFKPLIVMTLMGMKCFRKRTAFMAGFSMGQVSEFSLILAALGKGLGYINSDTADLITFVSLITIAVSTYMLNNSSLVYNWLAPWLGVFERNVACVEDGFNIGESPKVDVIIYGFGRHGEHLANILESQGMSVLGVDFDPRKVHPRRKHHRHLVRYGDAEDADFFKTLPLESSKWVISTIPQHDSNQMLVSGLHEMGYKGKIALSAYFENQIQPAKSLGVDLIFVPYMDAAYSAAQKIAANM